MGGKNAGKLLYNEWLRIVAPQKRTSILSGSIKSPIGQNLLISLQGV
jgi:hypothetical protein